MWWGKGTVFFFIRGKDYFRVIFAQNRLSEQKLCFFFRVVFFFRLQNFEWIWGFGSTYTFLGKII